MHTSEFCSPWIIFSLTKLCFPALSMMLKIAPLEIFFFFNLGVALEIFFRRRFSCKMQRARGGTNPNVGTVYTYSDHNGKHPRARLQRNASLWQRGHQKRAETEYREIRNTFCFLALFCFILFTTFLKREYAWQLYCGINTCGWRHLTLPAQIYKWTPAVWEILLKNI